MAKLLMGRDPSGNTTFGLQPTEKKWAGLLLADAQDFLTLPHDFPVWHVSFSYESASDVWVSYDQNVTIPVSSIAASASELRPGSRILNAGTKINLKTSDTSAQVSIIAYEYDI